MATKRLRKTGQQVVVYLDEHDQTLLDRVTQVTGLPKTEVFRQGLRRLADDKLAPSKPGSSLAHLIASARDDDLPADVAERHDAYLYDGGYSSRRASS
ncbi:MAG: hypothetical protein ABL963_06895 [Longimicrobiales bacterium]